MFGLKIIPQRARPVTEEKEEEDEEEEDEEEDDEKLGKLRVRKNCSSENAKISISLKGIA